MKCNSLLCFVVVVHLSVSGQRTPSISYITQTQIKDIGGSVELKCAVDFAREFPVLWTRTNLERNGDVLPISSSGTLIIRDSRFSVRHEAGATYFLQITDLQETDAGFYQCSVIISLTEKVVAEVDVIVRRPPIISDNSTRSLLVAQGQSGRLECYAAGYPTPRITWRRQDNGVLPSGGATYIGNVIEIPAISSQHRGTYYCVADNGVGRGDRRNINIEVEFPPIITVPRPRLGQALFYDMNLVCSVEAFPLPAIQWLKDEEVLTTNQHYSVSHFVNSDDFTDTILRVITIEKKQYGRYTCRAKNRLGSREAQVELFETVIPICPPECGQSARQTVAAANSMFSNVVLVILSVSTLYLRPIFII